MLFRSNQINALINTNRVNDSNLATETGEHRHGNQEKTAFCMPAMAQFVE